MRLLLLVPLVLLSGCAVQPEPVQTAQIVTPPPAPVVIQQPAPPPRVIERVIVREPAPPPRVVERVIEKPVVIEKKVVVEKPVVVEKRVVVVEKAKMATATGSKCQGLDHSKCAKTSGCGWTAAHMRSGKPVAAYCHLKR